jgi:hypothetical protein
MRTNRAACHLQIFQEIMQAARKDFFYAVVG